MSNMSDHIEHILFQEPDTPSIDLLRREIWIEGSIDPTFSPPIIRALRRMYTLNKGPITVFINSDGGDPHEAMAIADYMLAFNKQLVIRTSVTGVCYSAATLIAGAGTPGQRFAIPSAEYLIHQLSASGVAGEIEKQTQINQHLNALNNKIGRHLSNITGASLDRIKELMRGESYLSINEAKNLGLVDSVAIL